MTSPSDQPGQDDSDNQPDRESEQSRVGDSDQSDQPTQEASDQAPDESTGQQSDQSGPSDSNQTEHPGQDDSDDPADEQPHSSASSSEQAESEQAESEQAESEQAESEQAGAADDASAPKRKKTGLIVGIAAAAVVVILGGAAGLFFAFGTGQSAKSVAQEYVTVSTKETQNPRSVTAADYRSVVCKKSMPQIEKIQKKKEQFLKSAKPEYLAKIKKIKTSLKSVQTNGDSGKATFETTFPGQPPKTSELKLIKEDGDWKLCG